jgi:pimeloyl-ACP methyl ester carboxylesterase
MSKVHVTIMAGLGYVWSEGITTGLHDRLVKIPDVLVRVGAHSQYREFAESAKNSGARHLALVGHSLGAAVAGTWARLVGRPVAGVFGFDAADNLAANLSEYRNTPIPPNVAVARSVFVPGGALGGGGYTAENAGVTLAENWPIDTSHTSIEEAVSEHLTIEEFVKRLVEA